MKTRQKIDVVIPEKATNLDISIVECQSAQVFQSHSFHLCQTRCQQLKGTQFENNQSQRRKQYLFPILLTTSVYHVRLFKALFVPENLHNSTLECNAITFDGENALSCFNCPINSKPQPLSQSGRYQRRWQNEFQGLMSVSQHTTHTS